MCCVCAWVCVGGEECVWVFLPGGQVVFLGCSPCFAQNMEGEEAAPLPPAEDAPAGDAAPFPTDGMEILIGADAGGTPFTCDQCGKVRTMSYAYDV